MRSLPAIADALIALVVPHRMRRFQRALGLGLAAFMLRAVVAAVWAFSAAVHAATPAVTTNDLPRVPPTEPSRALSTFKVKEGFRLELVAAEPLVIDPIAMSFDENGRLFVVEMRDYSERRPERLGRVRMLTDTNHDGYFDHATVYVDRLPWPTAVFAYGGGVFIGATPDILYCRDTTGDGVSDAQEVVFTGFAADQAPFETNRLNVQALLNSFQWGLDNRIHGATSMSGAKVTSPRHPGQPALVLRGRDFSFDPRTLEMRAESGGGQHGMSFDNGGWKFLCSNSSHCQVAMYEDRYGVAGTALPLPAPAVNIAADGPAAEVFRLSPDEPWRVIRTRWRVEGTAPGPIEGGGRASGYFTGATGITIYRGDHWPEGFLGDAFIADCGSNLIHRKKVHPGVERVEPRAQRAPNEAGVEFVASTDNWFRPVQFANAPDGTLYVADMYREVIEHPWSLPPGLKEHLDLNSGNDRGRLYRIAAPTTHRRYAVSLGTASTAELVGFLEHRNGWHRDTASRLLYERQDASAIPALVKLLQRSEFDLGRLHALYGLLGLGGLKMAHLHHAVEDRGAVMREHGLRLLERLATGEDLHGDYWPARLALLARDPDVRVRYQLAWTLGVVDSPVKATALAELAGRARGDFWMEAAIVNAAGKDARALLLLTSTNGGTPSLVRRLAVLAGAQNSKLDDIFNALPKDNPSALFPVVLGLNEGLRRHGVVLRERVAALPMQQMFAHAIWTITNAGASVSSRVQAAQVLGLAAYDDVGASLFSALSMQNPPEVQVAALSTLAAYPGTATATGLIERWPELPPALRGRSLTALLERAERIEVLLKAIANREVPAAELNSTQVNFLKRHGQETVRAAAGKLFAGSPTGSRDEVRKEFSAALELKGVPERGQPIYLARCAGCHRLGQQGHALGPDLLTVRANGKEALLNNIIDPNREVLPQYVTYELETRDGETLLGILSGETEAGVTLRQANGIETAVPRSGIRRLRSVGQSAMPEGLEAGLTPSAMADLLEYLLSARP